MKNRILLTLTVLLMFRFLPLNISLAQDVSVPDAILAAAIRDEIGNSITKQTMLNLTRLDVTNLGITNLSGLEHAKNLAILGASNNSISDISALSGLTKLTYLNLDHNSISDISDLSVLTKLTELYLQNNSISDISNLSGLTKLTRLWLTDNSITDISDLSGLTELTELEIGDNSTTDSADNSVSDISALSELTKLTRLYLFGNSVSDISALSELTKLTELILQKNSISNISALSKLTELKELDLRDNSISDISALSGLTKLYWLQLVDNSISNISVLSGLTALTTLYLSHNSISDISALSGLTKLTRLSIFDNSVTNISDLSGLTELIGLSVGYNSISDISDLSGLTNLYELDLRNTSISDISTLSGLTNLEYLYLDSNNISDLSDLSGLTKLTYLTLQNNNRLSYAAINTQIPALKAKGISVYFTNRTPSFLSSVSGSGQTALVNTALTEKFVAEVSDEANWTFEGVPVTFSVKPTDGSLSVTQTNTDANGRAETLLTLGNTAGTYTVTAKVGSLTTTWTATATTPLTPTSLVSVSGNGQTGIVGSDLSAPLVVRVLDQNGGVMSGQTVSFSVSPTDGSLNPTSGTTGSNGQTQTQLTLGSTAGTYTVTATVGTLTTKWTATATTPLTPTSLVSVSGDGQTGVVGSALTAPLVVRVLDQNGDAMSGQTVSFSVSPTDGSLNPTSGTSGSNGQTQTALTLGSTTGTYTVTAKVGSLTTTWTATATTPLTPTSLVSVSGNGQTGIVGSDLSAPFVVRVLDQNGDAMSGRTVTFSVNPSDGSLNPKNGTTDANGQTQTRLTLGNTPGTYTVTATVGSLTTRWTATATAPLTPTRLVSVSGDGQTGTVGNALAAPLVVRVLDQHGNVLSGRTVTFSVNPSDGSLNPKSGTTDSQGQAQTELTLGSTQGTYTVTATVGTLTATWTATATARPPVTLTPTRLISVSGDGQTATVGNALAAPLVVRVLDQNGDAMSGRTVTFSVNPSAGSLNPKSGTTDANGQTQTRLTLGNTPGTYTVTATVGTLTTRWTATTTAPLTPTRLVSVSGDGQTATVGNALAAPLVVRVLDQNGNAMSGQTVSFSVSPTDGSLNPTSGTTDANGQTQTLLTLGNTAGTYTVTATVGTLTTTWTATANPATDPVSKPDSAGNIQEENEESQQPPSNDQTTEEPPQVEQPTTPLSKLAAPGQIGFSELMFASKGGIGSLSQSIELYNNATTESVNLRDWQLIIEARDADGTHRHAVITFGDVQIPSGKTALIVTSAAQNFGGFSDVNIYNLFEHHYSEIEQNQHRNMVLGLSGFYLKLSDPEGNVSDIAGNLDGDAQTTDKPIWELPNAVQDAQNRVSFLRKYDKKGKIPLDGTKLENFKPTSELQLSVKSYWGRRTDIGNPGHRRERVALPVTLSVFRADHTDAGVVLKWTTESEVDNAGFYIYRSETKNGEYKVVTHTMIQGAGTTGERTKYTWTDTTAKPNTVYYYRIEDVSHAGEREQLATVRLRGFISATGKRTTRWVDLKMSD